MARTFNVFSIAVVVLFVSWAYNVDPVLHTEVEIAAHPSEVRGVVLNWPAWNEWHSGMITRIETADGKLAKDLEKGDGIIEYISLSTKGFAATVDRNDAGAFAWSGSALAGAVGGEHYFLFEESKVTKGNTRFVHGEKLKGWMRWIYTLPVIDRHLHEWFNGLTLDVKSRVEKLKAEGKL